MTPNAATTGDEETTTSGSARCPGTVVRKKRPPRSRHAAREVNPQSALARLGQPLQATVGADKLGCAV